jgi:sugar lactone lactonase YvrE
MSRILKVFAIVLVALLAGSAVFFAQQNTTEVTPGVPDAQVIQFRAPLIGLIPEGIAWDASSGTFLVGSLGQGDIYRITPDETGGAQVTLAIEDADLMSTAGIELDTATNRLLVTNSSADAFLGGAGAAQLAAYDLTTGERLFLVDLAPLLTAPTHFANDVAADASGSAYVTDSFAPAIYRVTPQGEASVLVTDPLLDADFLGLNGIVYHPDGFLLVANSGQKTLLRVTLPGDEGAPVRVALVALDLPFGADGMFLADDGTLYAVARDASNVQFIAAVRSDDGWQSAQVERYAPATGDATTLTIASGTLAYVNAHLNDFLRFNYQIIQLPLR